MRYDLALKHVFSIILLFFSIVEAALRACRRVNDFSLTTRILEVVRIKCGNREAEIWPYMMQVVLE